MLQLHKNYVIYFINVFVEKQNVLMLKFIHAPKSRTNRLNIPLIQGLQNLGNTKNISVEVKQWAV